MIEEIAIKLGVEPNIIKALMEVESRGEYALQDGKIHILLERHWIYKLYRKKYGSKEAITLQKRYPNICSKKAGDYGLESEQYDRLALAIRLVGAEIAHLSTSFGAFQIMGFNHKKCGYESAVKMSDAYHKNPMEEQTKGFINYCSVANNGKLLQALKDKDFKKIARLYNGKKYWKHKYDVRIERAYFGFVKEEKLALLTNLEEDRLV